MNPVAVSIETISSALTSMVTEWANGQGVDPATLLVTRLVIEDGAIAQLQVARVEVITIK